MQFPHIVGMDLNLVDPLFALLEERHVTRAARRCGMSQSAMSRALDRLRGALNDELLVRSGGAYERTPRGEQLLMDLQDVLPRLDAAVRGHRFDPATSREQFNITTTDYAASIVIPTLMHRVATVAPQVRIEVSPWNDRSFDNMDLGRIQLAVIGAESREPFESEALFSDDFVCVVAGGASTSYATRAAQTLPRIRARRGRHRGKRRSALDRGCFGGARFHAARHVPDALPVVRDARGLTQHHDFDDGAPSRYAIRLGG